MIDTELICVKDAKKNNNLLWRNWMSIKSLKTPLRYPGGKSKAIKTLSQWYPKVITEYREPFIGGGSIAIDVTKENPDTVSYTHLTLPTILLV